MNNTDFNNNSDLYLNNTDVGSSNSNINSNINILNNNSDNSDNNNFNNDKYSGKIICIVIIVALILFGCFKIFNNKNGNTRDMVKMGEPLHIRQKNEGFDFEINVLNFDEVYHIDDFVFGGDYSKINVSIKNNSANELSLLTINFKLLDTDNNEISSVNHFMAFDFDGAINDSINANQTLTGNLYFNNINGGNIVSGDTKSIDKLEVGIPINKKSVNGKISWNYAKYYIKLK